MRMRFLSARWDAAAASPRRRRRPRARRLAGRRRNRPVIRQDAASDPCSHPGRRWACGMVSDSVACADTLRPGPLARLRTSCLGPRVLSLTFRLSMSRDNVSETERSRPGRFRWELWAWWGGSGRTVRHGLPCVRSGSPGADARQAGRRAGGRPRRRQAGWRGEGACRPGGGARVRAGGWRGGRRAPPGVSSPVRRTRCGSVAALQFGTHERVRLTGCNPRAHFCF